MDLRDVEFVPMAKYEVDQRGTLVKTRVYFTVAEVARDLVTRWGLGTPIPCGRNDEGQQIYTTLTPEVLAKRACDVAAHLMDEITVRGWYVDAPSPNSRPTSGIVCSKETIKQIAADIEAGRTDGPSPEPNITGAYPPRPVVEVGND